MSSSQFCTSLYACCPCRHFTTYLWTIKACASWLDFTRRSIRSKVAIIAIGKRGSKLNSVSLVGRIGEPSWLWEDSISILLRGGESKKSPIAGLEEIYVWAMRQPADRANITGGKDIIFRWIAERRPVWWRQQHTINEAHVDRRARRTVFKPLHERGRVTASMRIW